MFCGVITYRKGLDILLRAWPYVVARESSARLLVVGPSGDADDPDGTFIRKINDAANASHCKGTVQFAGYQRDVRDHMQAADIFTLPSRMEGTPNAVIEAMSVGLPCVVSDLPGVTGTFLRDKREGLIISIGDWEGLAASLHALVTNQALATEFGARARSRVTEYFSIDSVAQQYFDMFTAVGGKS